MSTDARTDSRCGPEDCRIDSVPSATSRIRAAAAALRGRSSTARLIARTTPKLPATAQVIAQAVGLGAPAIATPNATMNRVDMSRRSTVMSLSAFRRARRALVWATASPWSAIRSCHRSSAPAVTMSVRPASVSETSALSCPEAARLAVASLPLRRCHTSGTTNPAPTRVAPSAIPVAAPATDPTTIESDTTTGTATTTGTSVCAKKTSTSSTSAIARETMSPESDVARSAAVRWANHS